VPGDDAPSGHGPFYALLRHARLIRPDGHVRWWAIVAIAWVPMMIGALVRVLTGELPEPLVLDPSVHVRLLVSIPLLLLAHHSLVVRTDASLHPIRAEHPEAREEIDALEARHNRLRGSHTAEAIFVLAALVGGQATMWGLAPSAGWLGGLEKDIGPSFALFWYSVFALPLLQFLILRFLWRWCVWCHVLVKLARLDLATNAIHPDGAAGFKVLGAPVDAFAIFVAANCSVASAVWTTQIVEHDATVQTFVPRFVAFVVLAMVFACGPLFLFSPKIYRARLHDVHHYHALAREYVDAFRRKWIHERDPAEPVLGVPDIQSLNDLGGSYDKADATRAFAFGARSLIVLWIGAVLPMFPILLTKLSMADLLHAVGKMLQLPLM
jgi:hypothetical protein